MKFSKLLLAMVVGSEILSEVALAGKVNKHKPHKKRYNILTPKGTDNFTNIDDDMDMQHVAFDEQDFISVLLTDDQARNISAQVEQNGGIFEDDMVISLPPVTYYPIEDNNHTDENNLRMLKTVEAPNNPTPTIITGIPKFTGKLMHQDVAIMDSKIFPNSSLLAGYKVKIIGDTPDQPACLPHGTNVAEVIAQMFDPKKTDMQILNFPTFDCNGRGSIAAIAYSVNNILKYKKGPGKNRGLTVNFSGTGVSNSVINQLFKKLLDAGIPVIVASGNSGQPCAGFSPTNLALTSALISTGATEGQAKSTYSNYATPTQACVDIYLPGCLPMTNPLTGKPRTGCGTSFASPMQAGRTMIYQQRYNTKPKAAKLKQIKADTRKNSVTIEEDSVIVNSVTQDLAFSWPSRKPPRGRALQEEKPALRANALKL